MPPPRAAPRPENVFDSAGPPSLSCKETTMKRTLTVLTLALGLSAAASAQAQTTVTF